MSKRWLIAFVLALSSGAATWIVPGVTVVSSSDTPVSTELRILNRGDVPTNATIELISSVGTSAPVPVVQTIQPGQTLVMPNALAMLWNLTDGAGALRITADQTLTIRARSVRSTAAGTLFADLSTVKYEDLLPTGHIGHVAWVVQSADPSQGYRSIAGVVFVLPQSSANLVVYDAAGKELNRTTVKGGPGVQEVPLSQLVAADLPLGRIAFQTVSGPAAGYVALVNNTSGDTAQILATEPPNVAGLTLPGVAHVVNQDGSVAQTDVRLYNAATTSNTVTFTLLGASLPGLPATATVVLSPGQLREIPDVLGALFNATDSVKGALQVGSTAAAFVTGMNRSGALGALIPTDGDYLAAGDSGSVLAVKQPPLTTLGFVAGPDGATATVTARDLQGVILATTPAAVTLPPGGAIELTPDTLFPGVALPDESTLEVLPSDGEVYPYARTVDATSGDTSLQTAALFEPYDCPLPGISSFAAAPATLAAAGKSSLFWSVAGADTIQISPGPATTVAASGSQPVNLTATTTYTLTATGVCGAATQTVTVAVGSPALQSASPATGQPGQQVSLKIGNMPDTSTITSALFTFPDKTAVSVPINDVDANGALLVSVPLVPPATGSGYRTGAVTISIPNSTGSAAFNIATAAYRGDSVKDFGDLVSSIVGLNQQIAQQYAQSSDGAFASSLTQMTSQTEVWLRKLASDISTSGTSNFPGAPAGSVTPNPTTPITRADLDLFMAVLQNLNQGQSLAAQVSQARMLIPRVARPRAGANGPCMSDLPGYNFCVTVIANGSLFRILFQILNLASTIPGVGPISKGTLLAAQLGAIRCLFRNLVLENFVAQPQVPPGYVRVITPQQRNETKVRIQARLRREYQTKQELYQDMFGLTPAGSAYEFFRNYVERNVADPIEGIFVNQDVFICDLFLVEPTRKGRPALSSPRIGPQAEHAYLFKGRRPQKQAELAVNTYEGSFVWETGPIRGQRANHSTKSTTKLTGVDVGGKFVTFKVNTQSARFGPVTGIKSTDVIDVTPTYPIAFSYDLGSLGRANYEVRGLNDTAWEVQMAASAQDNSNFGTTNLLLTGTTDFVRANPPVQSRITYSSQGSVSTYVGADGRTNTGQLDMTDYAAIGCATPSGTQTLALNHAAIGPPYSFTPAPITCPDTVTANFSSDINGFIGAFQGTVNILIEIDDGSSSQLAFVPRALPDVLLRRRPAVELARAGPRSSI